MIHNLSSSSPHHYRQQFIVKLKYVISPRISSNIADIRFRFKKNARSVLKIKFVFLLNFLCIRIKIFEKLLLPCTSTKNSKATHVA